MHKTRILLSKYLAALFDSGEITKAELSRRTGISRPMIDAYLKGSNAASLDQLERIADALGLDPWDLIRPAEKAALSTDKRDAVKIIRTLSDSAVRDLLPILRNLK